MDGLEITVKEEVEDEDEDYMEFIPEIVLKEDHEDHSVLVKEALVQSDSEDEENDDFDPFSGDSKQKRVETKRKVINKKMPIRPQSQAKTIEKAKYDNSLRCRKDKSDSDFDSDDNIALSNIKKDQEKKDTQKPSEDSDEDNTPNEEQETNDDTLDKNKEPDSEKKLTRKITRELKYICLAKQCKKVPTFESPFEYIDHMKIDHKKTLSVAKIKASISFRKDAKPIIQIDPENCSDFVICKKCNHEFSTHAGLEKHTEKGKCNKVQCNFICNYCNKDMQRMDLRNLHIELEHPEEEKDDFLTCQMCNAQFETKQGIADHYTAVHDNQFECQHCSKTFAQAKLLILHNRQQHRLVGFKCDECGKCCRSVKELQHHIQVHNTEANIKCPDCELMFTSTVKMNYHNKHVHNTGEFTCQVCSQTFVTRHRLNLHNYNKHKEKNFQCHICAKKFLTNRELIRHVLWHEGLHTYKNYNLKQYSCSLCDMITEHGASIRRHMKNIHGQKHGYSATPLPIEKNEDDDNQKPNDLRTRKAPRKRRSPDDSTPQSHYSCLICDKHFPEKRYLANHMRRQSVHMKHNCEICHEEILGIVNFRNHRKSHSKDAAYYFKTENV